jgi:simple sugar transport system substrate-binding protein
VISGMMRILGAALVAISVAGSGAHAAEKLRFVMVTHGATTDRFWSRVKEGAEEAAKEADVTLIYRAPDKFDLDKMAALAEAAVKEAPDGLIISVPNADAVAGPIHDAVEAGIPVITINSGFDVGRSLGALLHVGQSEYEAGRVAGDAMRKLGGTKALCLNHELGNVGLDLRCKGFIDGFAGSVEVMPVEPDPVKAQKTIADKLAEDTGIDVILALSANYAGEPAVTAVQALAGRTVHIGTFDVTDAMLNAVADGAASFLIDQQPFLQGYLPVQYLALLRRHGVIPVSNVSTGPRLVTMEDAKKRLGRSDAAPGPEADPTAAEPAPAGAKGG